MRSYDLWIGGKTVASKGGGRAVRRSPTHGGELASFALGTEEDLNAAVTAANSALECWSNTNVMERATLLTNLVDLMQEDLDNLARIDAEDVDLISFTGSTAVGRTIGEKCAGQAKRGGLELGGRTANIVFADADLDDALDGAVFGPVVSITTFETVNEAVDLANGVDYGLGNGIWTKDIDKAHQVSRRLESGTLRVNSYLDGVPQMPFGGYKRSGLGRENGKEGLTEFMQVKSTFFRLGKRSKALPHTA